MKLMSEDSGLELTLVGYEYPNDAEDEFDANWLLVSGRVRTSGMRSWSFTDPCLTTWEAGQLAQWLSDVGDADYSPGHPPPVILEFLEPNLTFSSEAISDHLVRLSMTFRVESLPPWVRTGEPAIDASKSETVEIDIEKTSIRAAARDWRIELERFPKRPPG